MLPLRHFLLVILLPLSVSAFANAGDDCAARLAAGNRYLGMVSARLKAGLLSIDDLRKIAASGVPLNPLKNETPGSHNSGAKRIFDSLVTDPEVISQWNSTRVGIEELIDQQTSQTKARERAEKHTSKILHPRVHSSIPDKAGGHSLTVLPDQRAVAALVRLGRVSVIDLATNGEIASLPMPEDLEYVGVAWHRDSSDHPWIYIFGELPDSHLLHVYSAKWGENSFRRIISPENTNQISELDFGSSLKSVAPGHIVADTSKSGFDRYFELDSGTFVEITPKKMLETSFPPGLNVRAPKRPEVLYRTQSGRVYRAGTRGEDVIVSSPPVFGPQIVARLPMPPIELSFHEEGEHLYLAITQFGKIDIYEPLVNAKTPLVSVQAEMLNWAQGHWFHSPEGDLFFASATYKGVNRSGMILIDVNAHLSMEFPTSGPPEQWVSAGGQTYFSVRRVEGKKLEIYSVFNDANP